MTRPKVSIVRYEEPRGSVRRAIELCGGLDHLPAGARVFLKPNIVQWSKAPVFPKYGVITTSRVVEDVVHVLKEHGVDDLTIGEGVVTRFPKDKETPAHAFESLGWGRLKQKYGVKFFSVFERPFRSVDLGGGVTLDFNVDALESDFIVSLPVLKTHSQSVFSGGIKNLKGLIDLESRKKCHSTDPVRDLHYYVSYLSEWIPPSLTVLDGIYTLERGPLFDGKARRSDLLVASADMLSADLVGARVLGHDPAAVPHLKIIADRRGRPLDLSDLEVVGERIEDVESYHLDQHIYNEQNDLPLPLVKMGVQGVSYHKYDETICTYCSGLQWVMITAIAMAWGGREGRPWDDVEILNGKKLKPSPGRKKTVLIGKCMYEANKDDPNINELIAVKGCPPGPKAINKALHQAGLEIDPAVLEKIDEAPALFNRKYENKPEFSDDFYRVQTE